MKRILFFTIIAIVVTSCVSHAPIDSTNTATSKPTFRVTSTVPVITWTATPNMPTPNVSTPAANGTETAPAISIEAGLNPDLKNEKSLPTVTLDFAISQEFSDTVQQWVEGGKLPTLKGIPFKPGILKQDLSSHPGATGAIFYEFDYKKAGDNTYWEQPQNMPTNNIVWAAKVEGLGGGFQSYLIMQGINNGDGKVPGVQLMYARPPAGMSLATFLAINSFGDTAKHRFVPGGRFLDPAGCMRFYSFSAQGAEPNKDFCAWYFAHPDTTNVEAIYRRLVQTGEFRNIVNGKFVLPFSPLFDQQMPADQ